MSGYSFELDNVFAEERFGGNPLAVFSDASGLSSSMADLFSASRAANVARAAPLAARMRPRRLADYIGQATVVGPGTLLRRLIEAEERRDPLKQGLLGCAFGKLPA